MKARIAELASFGLKPIMAVIEETNDKSRETYWIRHLVRLGVPLLNKIGMRKSVKSRALYMAARRKQKAYRLALNLQSKDCNTEETGQ